MALYMKIPKDLNGIKDKVAMNLTKRQLICFGLGLAVGLTMYWLTYNSLGTQTAAVLLFCFGSPFFIVGLYKDKNGFPLEKMALNLIRFNICPKIRPYKTDNIYRQIIDEIEYTEEVEMVETGRKKVKIQENKNRTAN